MTGILGSAARQNEIVFLADTASGLPLDAENLSTPSISILSKCGDLQNAKICQICIKIA
jgi:hypothetical protein